MRMRSLLPRELTAGAVAEALWPVTLAAALAEAAALRLTLRMGQALPDRPGFGASFGAVADAGVVAQNLATLAGTLTLAALAFDRLGRPSVTSRTAGALLMAATVGITLAAAGAGGPVWAAAHLLSLAAMAAAVASATVLPRPGGRAWLALPLAAYVALVYHFSAPAAASAGLDLPLAAEAYFIAEGAAVAAALALPFAVRPRWRWRALAGAAALPAVVMLALLTRPWTVASLSVWTFGFTLFLPAPVYPLALASLLYVLTALARGNRAERRAAVGLVLVALGGLKLDYSYFNLLALLGMCLLTATESAETETVDAIAASSSETRPARRAGEPVAVAGSRVG